MEDVCAPQARRKNRYFRGTWSILGQVRGTSEDFSTWDQISSYFVKIMEKKDESGKNVFRIHFSGGVLSNGSEVQQHVFVSYLPIKQASVDGLKNYITEKGCSGQSGGYAQDCAHVDKISNALVESTLSLWSNKGNCCPLGRLSRPQNDVGGCHKF